MKTEEEVGRVIAIIAIAIAIAIAPSRLLLLHGSDPLHRAEEERKKLEEEEEGEEQNQKNSRREARTCKPLSKKNNLVFLGSIENRL